MLRRVLRPEGSAPANPATSHPPDVIDLVALSSDRLAAQFRQPASLLRAPPVTLTVGRGDGVDICFANSTISRQHMVLRAQLATQTIHVQCTGIAGASVNGRRVQSADLRPGDQLVIGGLTKRNFVGHHVTKHVSDLIYEVIFPQIKHMEGGCYCASGAAMVTTGEATPLLTVVPPRVAPVVLYTARVANYGDSQQTASLQSTQALSQDPASQDAAAATEATLQTPGASHAEEAGGTAAAASSAATQPPPSGPSGAASLHQGPKLSQRSPHNPFALEGPPSQASSKLSAEDRRRFGLPRSKSRRHSSDASSPTTDTTPLIPAATASLHRALSSQTGKLQKSQAPGAESKPESKPKGEPAAGTQLAPQPGTDASQTLTRRVRRSKPQPTRTAPPAPLAAPKTNKRGAERLPSQERDSSDSDVRELVVDYNVAVRRCSVAEPRAKRAHCASSSTSIADGNPNVFVVVDDDSDDDDAAPKAATRTAKSKPNPGLTAAAPTTAGQIKLEEVEVATGAGAGTPRSPLGNTAAAAAAGQGSAASRASPSEAVHAAEPSCATPAVAAGESATATATGSPGVASAAVAENQGMADLVGELECIVCFELLAAPAALGCGHTFCRPCLARVLQEYNARCPTCRAPAEQVLERQIMVEKLVRRVLDTLPTEEREAHEQRTAEARQVPLRHPAAKSGPQHAATSALQASHNAASATRELNILITRRELASRAWAPQPEAEARGGRDGTFWDVSMMTSRRTSCKVCRTPIEQNTPVFTKSERQRERTTHRAYYCLTHGGRRARRAGFQVTEGSLCMIYPQFHAPIRAALGMPDVPQNS